MEIDIIFKIAGIGILIAVLNQVLKKAGSEDHAMVTTIAGIVVVLTMVIGMISRLFNEVKTVFKLY
ncbi:stage III sporulation protein AC [Abyssisolibacter fermentans]|uniref:stage III sporulation protein AC n=1 Tax=Abyssisolibacter fermentans TaxID=1766203 RepID=UPI0008322EBF|nr:stage III sporulation protein AC [Abyssisolibacter fermentans]